MTDTFNWPVQVSSNGGGSFRTKKAPFGDGYSQEVPDGLNAEVQTVTVVTEGLESEMREIIDFARAHKAESFYWTPPMSDECLFRCKGYKWSTHDGGYRYNVTLEFEQTFVP